MPVRYDQDTKAKAIRLVREHAGDYPSEYVAITAVARRLGMTPETAAAPGSRKSGQAQACPRAARGAQNPWVAGRKSRPNARTQANRRSTVTRSGKITNLGWCQGSSEAEPSRIK